MTHHNYEIWKGPPSTLFIHDNTFARQIAGFKPGTLQGPGCIPQAAIVSSGRDLTLPLLNLFAFSTTRGIALINLKHFVTIYDYKGPLQVLHNYLPLTARLAPGWWWKP